MRQSTRLPASLLLRQVITSITIPLTALNIMFYVQFLRDGQWQNLLGYAPTDWESAVERHYEYVCTYLDMDYRIVSA